MARQYHAAMNCPSEKCAAQAGVRPDPAKIVVPRKHGQVLVEPSLAVLAEALAQPRPWSAVHGLEGARVDRGQARRELLDAARVHAERIGAALPPADALDRPWVITGHQVEFYHAGVWAQLSAADVLARRGPRGGAVAFDLLVDHDVVDHLGFDVPVQEGRTWQRRAVTWGAASHVPADGLKAPTPAQFEEWDAALARHPLVQSDALAHVLADLKPNVECGMRNAGLTPWFSRARRRLEAALGLTVHHVPTSLLCAGEAWWSFVRLWIEHADQWTAVYNRHLAAYRKRAGIKNPQHPMPDLHRVGTAIELPFWIYRMGDARERLFVRRRGGEVVLLHGSEEIGLNAECGMRNAEFVIRPRALTLTMFVRLFLADLFIHGIGGALYDQITDGIMQELFGIVPSYACVSAAWLLPLGQAFEPEDIATLRWQRHHVEHNPQQAIDPFTARKTDVAELIAQRRELVERIAQSLREDRKGGRAFRNDAFRQLHAVNAALHVKVPGALGKLDRQIAEAVEHLAQNQTLLWREWYFALHSMEALRQLVAAVSAG
jgi:hypothetical protein